MEPKTQCCYLLRSTVVYRTYVGYTNNLKRRIRQHNREIKGGAKSSAYGRPWEIVCYITGFPSSTAALQFEHALHKCRKGGAGAQGRVTAIEHLLTVQRWSKRAPLVSSLNLMVHWCVEGVYFSRGYACDEILEPLNVL